MTEITLVGIDLAKNVFQLCATDGSGRIVKERRLRRAGLLSELSALPPCVVAMEACGGAHDWGRRIAALGHEVRLLHPRRVAAFVGAHKNDRVDTRAICEAARQPGTRFVPVKNLRQQELQSLVRLRDGLVKQRTSSITRLRSILHEHGLVLPKGRQAGLRRFRQVAAEAWPAEISELLSEMLFAEAEHIEVLTRRIVLLKRVIEKAVKTDQQGRRLLSIPGIGPLTAAALLAAVGDASVFANGRALSAWLGLVPRQDGTGGRVRLCGITKHGNSYIRRNLVHGARAVIHHSSRRKHPAGRLERWINARRGDLKPNILTVAVANRLARQAWAVLNYEETFNPEPSRRR